MRALLYCFMQELSEALISQVRSDLVLESEAKAELDLTRSAQ